MPYPHNMERIAKKTPQKFEPILDFNFPCQSGGIWVCVCIFMCPHTHNCVLPPGSAIAFPLPVEGASFTSPKPSHFSIPGCLCTDPLIILRTGCNILLIHY